VTVYKPSDQISFSRVCNVCLDKGFNIGSESSVGTNRFQGSVGFFISHQAVTLGLLKSDGSLDAALFCLIIPVIQNI
jgi:hypothetical protein